MNFDRGTLVVAEMPGGEAGRQPTYRVGVLAKALDVPVSGVPPKRVLLYAWGVQSGNWTGQKPASPCNPVAFAVVQNDEGELSKTVAAGVARCKNSPDAELQVALEKALTLGLAMIGAVSASPAPAPAVATT